MLSFLQDLIWTTGYLCTQFDNCRLGHFSDIIGTQKNKNGSHDVTTPVSEMVCYL